MHTSTEALHARFREHPHVYIDTRTPIAGGIFFAVGQKDPHGHHRGNQFAAAALREQQAAFAVINQPALLEQHPDLAERFLLVEDCEQALQALAAAHRKTVNPNILVIAGSNGKTTTKQLIASVLASTYNVYSTRGNLNNHLGVPLSLLELRPEHNFAVLEVGANHLGETRALVELIRPQFGYITNCGKDHLGEYGSLENIERANGELFDYLEANNGIAFIAAEDQTVKNLAVGIQHKIQFGEGTHLYGEYLELPFLKLRVHYGRQFMDLQTQLFGAFWRDALLVAVAVGSHFGVRLQQIGEALVRYQPGALRSELIEWGDENEVLLDCYNANPSSMEAFLLAVESSRDEPKILILGEMLELGAFSRDEHRAVLLNLHPSQYAHIALVGESWREVLLDGFAQIQHFGSTAEAKTWLDALAPSKAHIFVKGSRANRLESLFGR